MAEASDRFAVAHLGSDRHPAWNSRATISVIDGSRRPLFAPSATN